MSCVRVLHKKPLKLGSFTSWSCNDGKERVKNSDASKKLLFYQSNPITLFPFLLPSRRHGYLIPVLSLQAAIGSVSLDMARERGFTGMLQEELGIQVITVYNPLLVALFVLVHVQWCQKGSKILMMACALPFGPVHVVQLVKRLFKVEAVVFFLFPSLEQFPDFRLSPRLTFMRFYSNHI